MRRTYPPAEQLLQTRVRDLIRREEKSRARGDHPRQRLATTDKTCRKRHCRSAYFASLQEGHVALRLGSLFERDGPCRLIDPSAVVGALSALATVPRSDTHRSEPVEREPEAYSTYIEPMPRASASLHSSPLSFWGDFSGFLSHKILLFHALFRAFQFIW